MDPRGCGSWSGKDSEVTSHIVAQSSCPSIVSYWMMSLLPSSPDIVPDSDPKVVGVDSEEADDLMSALSSETARNLVSELHEDPAPPAELADRLDTTLQNTQYHLERLESAGVVEVAGTAYSEKGREMNVYAPADDPLVIFAGRDEQASGLRAALKRLVGGVGALAVGAIAIQETFGRSIVSRFIGGTGSADAGAGGGDGGGGDAGAVNVSETVTAEREAGTATATPSPERESTTPTATGSGDINAQDATETATEAPSSTPVSTETPVEEAATPTPTAEATGTPTPEPTAVGAPDPGGLDVVASLPPGALFFLGGLLILVAGIALTYRRGAL